MARLQVIALSTIGIERDEVVVHGQIVVDGGVEVYGDCGDGTVHPLRYAVRGSPGASWYLRIRCDSDLVYVDDVTIGATGTFESGPRELRLSPITLKMLERDGGHGEERRPALSTALQQQGAAIMSYKLKVETNDAVQTCALFLDEEPIVDFNEDGEAELQLTAGEHYFYYDVRGSGAEVSLDLEGEREVEIIEPAAEWPFEIKVPDDRTGEADRFYIRVGA